MGYTIEDAVEKSHDANRTAKNSSMLGVLGTLLGAAGAATGITALATKVPKNGNCGQFNNNGFDHCGGRISPTPYEVERKECEDNLELTRSIYQTRINDITEKNDLERFLSGKINANENSDIQRGFELYKSQRDGFDILNDKINSVSTHVAVTDAVLPWQLKAVADNAEKELSRRTCRMISGEVVLPNTPIVSGYGSYGSPCFCPGGFSAPTSAAKK